MSIRTLERTHYTVEHAFFIKSVNNSLYAHILILKKEEEHEMLCLDWIKSCKFIKFIYVRLKHTLAICPVHI